MCKCQECGKLYKIDLLIPDDLWNKITPNKKHKHAGLLCGSCIMVKLEKMLDYDYFHLMKITTT